MTSFTELLQQGAAHAWLFIPSAIVLGALHGLEPGHSKTMIAAFIIAVRGTVKQAVLLGLCATLSHTAIVWVIALGGLYLWRGLAPESIEPYLQVGSAVMILGMGSWMIWRTATEQRHSARHHDHDHDHDHDDHDHHHHHDHDHEPVAAEFQDAHERAHALDIQRRFAGKTVTTGQIMLFGLTGGLIPCPGAITVLLLCLQLKAFALGAVLVLCFSLGLALTMVTSGVLAALSVKHLNKTFSGFGELVRKAPYFSGGVIMLIGVYLGINGLVHLLG
jgi:nickel/cobalt exporter